MQRSVLFLFLFLSISPFEFSSHIVEEPQTGKALPAFPCSSLSLNQQGLICQIGDPFWETTLFLPFPRLSISEKNVGSLRALPVSSVTESVYALTIQAEAQALPLELKEVQITLFFVPAIPNTLIPYLADQWLSWGQDRVPYVGRWEVTYLKRVGDSWLPQYFSGEIAPKDIPNFPSDLVADINYNGVPTAFWNYQVFSP
mgnify:CR=1 FL=1|jgi:hypothetical protein